MKHELSNNQKAIHELLIKARKPLPKATAQKVIAIHSMIAMVLKLGLSSGDSGEILRLAKVKTEEVMSAYKIVREAIDSPGPIAAGSDIFPNIVTRPIKVPTKPV